MAKGKPRWKKVSAYELATEVLRGKPSSLEAENAGKAALEMYRKGGRPEASIAPGGKIVVR